MQTYANIFDQLPEQRDKESFTDLLREPGLLIERIVSYGQASPPDFWYDQFWDEWVVVLRGYALMEFQNPDGTRVLQPGDHCWLPAGLKHRIVRTDAGGPTIWLAVHRGRGVDLSPSDTGSDARGAQGVVEI